MASLTLSASLLLTTSIASAATFEIGNDDIPKGTNAECVGTAVAGDYKVIVHSHYYLDEGDARQTVGNARMGCEDHVRFWLGDWMRRPYNGVDYCLPAGHPGFIPGVAQAKNPAHHEGGLYCTKKSAYTDFSVSVAH